MAKFKIINSFTRENEFGIDTDGYGILWTSNKKQWEEAIEDGYIEIDLN